MKAWRAVCNEQCSGEHKHALLFVSSSSTQKPKTGYMRSGFLRSLEKERTPFVDEKTVSWDWEALGFQRSWWWISTRQASKAGHAWTAAKAEGAHLGRHRRCPFGIFLGASLAWVSPVGLADCASLLPDDLTEHPTSVGLLRRSVGSVSLGLSASLTQRELNTAARFRKRGNMRSTRLMLWCCGWKAYQEHPGPLRQSAALYD